jgi:hypothetical protein
MKPRVKFAEGSTTSLDILAVPFGGPFAGRGQSGVDTDGEYFSAKTDLCLDWFPTERPLLYHHGMDGGPGVAAIGRVDSATARKDVDGWWVRAQLDESNAYFDSIAQLVAEGKLYASSGAMPHLVRRGKGGELTRWPWVELSLTPTPANLFATVQPVDAEKHYKAAGLDFATKAPADSIPALGDDGDAPEGSLEDLLQDLTRALNAGSMFSPAPFGDAYAYPVATFMPNTDGYCIVKVCQYDYDGEADAPPFYRVEFSIGPDLEPVLGAATPYDLAYIPATPDDGEAKSGDPLDALPLVLAAELTRNLAAVVTARTRDVQERRVKEGRTLSTANKERLQALFDAITEGLSSLGDLLTSADPPAKASADALRLLELRHRTQQLRREQ